jgi:leader peptidase (prepilin peptidase)/N-methyltransferase
VNAVVVGGCAVAGALAGVPIAALAYGAPAAGPIHLPVRWWTGAPAGRRSVLGVVALCAGAAAITGAAVPASAVLPAFWLFAVVGVALAIIDLRCRRLPYLLTGALLATSALCFAVAVMTGAHVGSIARAALTGSITAAVLLMIALAVPGQLGLGDVALAGAIALNLGWLSWQAAFLGVACGLLVQATMVAIARSLRLGSQLSPMGPALICGWLLVVVLAG